MQEKDWPRPSRAGAAPVKEQAPAEREVMPAVSPEFMAWIRKVMIQELHSFSTMTPDQALKQIAFANGILWLKALIYQGNEANRQRTTVEELTLVAPDSIPKE